MISLKNIKCIFNAGTKREVRAVDDISLDINEGEIFGIIGLSGAGKSTLVRTINQLERPSSGDVIVDGKNMTSLKGKGLREARKSIGMIFQNFNLLSSATVEENVAFPLTLDASTNNKAYIQERVASLLELVGLSDKAKMYPAQLSGGQKQRVGIARALASKPKILLCDEATSALDPKTTSSILELLQDLRKKLNLTIVIITHQMEVIKECCDRVAVMDHGKIVELATALDLFTNAKHPLSRRLVSSVVNRGFNEILLRTEVSQTYVEGSKAIVEILFIGDKAEAPVIVDVAQICNVKISICAGTIDHIKESLFGTLVVEIQGNKEEIEHAISELNARVNKVEVLGYDIRK